MALPAASYHTAGGGTTLIGVREDLSNIIHDITPMDTIFQTSIGRGTAKQTLHEWQTHGLATFATAASANAAIEGDDATNDAIVLNVRLGNRTQIMDKVVQVTGTAEAVDKAGIKSEMAQEMFYRMRELKRDLEGQFCQNPAIVASAGTGARKAGGIETWITDNTSDRGATGADTAGIPAAGAPATPGTPTDSAQPTDGTQRDITETIFKNVLQLLWTNGGDGSLVIAGPVNKQKIDGFAGNATPFVNVEGGMRQATFSVYVSPFGRHKIVPSRYVRERSCLFLTPEYAKIAYLRPFQSKTLAITGDSLRKQILVEATLEVCNPIAHGIAADLTTT